MYEGLGPGAGEQRSRGRPISVIDVDERNHERRWFSAARGMAKVRYRNLFSQPDFTALFVADGFSITGSYLARVAVGALVYQRTGSPALTAVAFAVSYVPYLLSPWLSTFADLFPRRRLLIIGDLARAACVGGIIIPGQPLELILTLLFLEAMCRVPWGSARLALLSDILTKEHFPAGNALVSSTRQALQVGGFAAGGIVVASIGARPTLVVDAVTFVVSAAIIGVYVRERPAPWIGDSQPDDVVPETGAGTSPAPLDAESMTRPTTWASTKEGLRTVADTPRMPQLFMLLGLGPAIVVVTEGLAVPFADELGGGVTLAGFIMAAPPLGNVIGLFIFGRLPFDKQQRWVAPMAICGALMIALVGVAALTDDSAYVIVALLGVAGASLAYVSAIQSEISAAVDPAVRGRVFGLGNAVLQLAQGGAILLGGIVASSTTVAPSLIGISVIGALGLLAVTSGLPELQSRIRGAPEATR